MSESDFFSLWQQFEARGSDVRALAVLAEEALGSRRTISTAEARGWIDGTDTAPPEVVAALRKAVG